jgi:D-alanyl-D-alanine carboxypeptidase/D-alanyl-D-alanine-endopeptidase (penicillin-binding protein 4)
VALITLAMVNVFTLAAGVVLARMLPPRLALLKPVRVAARADVRARPVLAGVTGGPMPTSSGLSSALTGLLSSPALGSGVAAVVADAAGNIVYSRGGSQMTAPASTEKLATAVAALDVLGPGAQFRTRVVSGPGHRIVLVGGGDPTLAAGPAPSSDYPQPATLKDLAAQTATSLKAQHRRQVQLGYDVSLYTGPGMAPGWPESYVTSGDVTQITALEVDQGRLTPGGAPEDADDPVNFQPRSADPVSMAVTSFESFLASDGIQVEGTPSPATAPARATALGSVSSPPLSAMVEWMMQESNNVIAENLARHVAIAMADPASFAGAATAETAALRRLGAGSGVQLVDGSGLSPDDRIAPDTLVRLLTTAASPQHPALRPAITGMPVAGFSGTLSTGQSVFGAIGGPARGVVRAKTGNLTTVAALAGFAYDSDGRLLEFVFNAAHIPTAASLQTAANTINNAAETLAACGCR